MGRLVSRWSMSVVAVVAVVVGLVACGGSSSGGSADPSGDPGGGSGIVAPAAPSGVAARVGGSTIPVAMVEHWLVVEKRREHLVPPQYAACVVALRAAARTSGASAASVAKLTVAQLRSACEVSEHQLLNEALERYIAGNWVIGGARELGVDVTGQAFQRRFAAVVKQAFHTQAAFQSYLASTGRTAGDIRFQVHVALDSDAIREAIKKGVPPVTAAQVRHYYDRYRSHYFFQQTRDVEIAATPTRAASLAVRRKIESGESFASVVKGLNSPQATLSKEGLAVDLPSGYYKEPSLNHAIFTTRPGVLIGPIKTVIGYFVIRLKTIHPAYQQPLSAVSASIKALLPGEHAQEALVDYIKAWRARWIARTSCSQGYVIRKCREFKVPATAPPEDPYTLH
jgi:parvulin-like peptidyl-prolyl isomerase